MNLDQLRTWATGHRTAVLGTAAAGVGALALYHRHQAAADPAASAAVPNSDPTTAGLSGAVDTSNVDFENEVLAELAQQNQQIANLGKRPARPHGPTPAPRPGQARYTVRKGDTLDKIAQAVYGRSDAHALSILRHGNPILLPYGPKDRLDFLAGHTIAVPRWTREQQNHNPGGTPTPTPRPRPRQPRQPKRPKHPKQHQPKVPHQPQPPKARKPKLPRLRRPRAAA